MNFTFLFIFLISLGSSFANAQLELNYNMQVSKGRNDGIQISMSPHYPYSSELFLTLDESSCYSKGNLTPLKNRTHIFLVATFNQEMNYDSTLSSFFDTFAPAGVDICYMLIGRGRVEASAWGRRMANWDYSNNLVPLNYGFYASRDRSDSIELTLNPKIFELADLYVSPSQDRNCPEVGSTFKFEGRFYQVMNEPFNGAYYLDSNAPIGIDLCYFLINKGTQKCLARANGFRNP